MVVFRSWGFAAMGDDVANCRRKEINDQVVPELRRVDTICGPHGGVALLGVIRAALRSVAPITANTAAALALTKEERKKR